MAHRKGNGGSEENPGGARFVSKLAQGRQRFLAHVIEHSLEIGRRSAGDFIRHFPPHAIMEGLADKPALRAEILAHTTGIKKKIAERKAWGSAAEDLDIALAEGETNAEAVVSVFSPDDRVLYLSDRKIWAFLIEGEFWTATSTKKDDYQIAKKHLAFMLDRALEDKLLTHRDVVEGITVAEMAMRLPKAELGKIITVALDAGQRNMSFTEVELLGAMPPSTLVDFIPLSHIYESVIVPKVADAHGYVEPRGAAAPEKAEAEAVAPPPGSQDWVEMNEMQEEAVDEDEISDDDFASP
jgi:hypothetical protein